MTPANDNTPQQRPVWFDNLLQQYDGFIRAKCRTVRWNDEEAEDLYQDVLLRAVERWYRYRRDGNFAAWITYLMRESVELPERKKQRLKKWPEFMPPRTTEATQEYSADIGKAIAMLSEPEREAILSVASGYSGEEVGIEMGVSRQRVWQIVEGGRDWLAANDDVKKAA